MPGFLLPALGADGLGGSGGGGGFSFLADMPTPSAKSAVQSTPALALTSVTRIVSGSRWSSRSANMAGSGGGARSNSQKLSAALMMPCSLPQSDDGSPFTLTSTELTSKLTDTSEEVVPDGMDSLTTIARIEVRHGRRRAHTARFYRLGEGVGKLLPLDQLVNAPLLEACEEEDAIGAERGRQAAQRPMRLKHLEQVRQAFFLEKSAQGDTGVAAHHG
eukprot:scaffold20355_cov31-Tisochrysis_lutea.AAC.5